MYSNTLPSLLAPKAHPAATQQDRAGGRTTARRLLAVLAVLLLMGLADAAQARSLTECTRNIRVGSKLVLRGDDAARVYRLFDSQRRWTLVRASGGSQVWRRKGRAASTVRLKLRDGKVERICQSDR